ncbi:hypothetical protein DRE_00852 [Drechslerella stenobrocha 248]|uniref:Uncharacterized protein n=1 Tax=Drechslerella stenobrocha 248 TaxID=1043628 RepID=W7HZX4_9PEZI|nr:hypothetical protein DRE_00852 [Drechslerella stenobrocha 248]
MSNEASNADSVALTIATADQTTKPLEPALPRDITRSYLLDPSSLRNYDSLTEQLLEDHQRPQKTKVHLDVNLSVELDLTPEVHGDLHLSMLTATVGRKPWEEDVIGSNGRRIAGTVLRISDGSGQLLHRQVVGFESFGEWWWVVRTQLRELVKRKITTLWQQTLADGGRGVARAIVLLGLPLVAQTVLIWWWWWKS